MKNTSLALVAAGATAVAFLACSPRYGAYPRYLSMVESPRRGAELPTGGDSYDRVHENPFLEARDNPLSTFSVDVDTASYANVRRFLDEGTLPSRDAVRLEELV